MNSSVVEWVERSNRTGVDREFASGLSCGARMFTGLMPDVNILGPGLGCERTFVVFSGVGS